MTIKLSRLLEEIKPLEVIGETDKNIESLQSDSRKVGKGGMFVAVRGVTTDGHRYIPVVASAHVAAIVCEDLPASIEKGITYIRVADSAEALGRLASAWYGHPSSQLRLVGVTGTNGKTTVATLLCDLFGALGYRAGLISTVVYRVGNRETESTHTTPDAVRLNAMLREMVDAGCEYCFMEVSSHSIVQERIRGLKFEGAVFTNITHDHLDYHKTFAEYIKAKKRLFDSLPEEAFALVNADDRNGEVMAQNTRARTSRYSLRAAADFNCKIVEMLFDGMLLRMDGSEVWVNFLGRFNACNLLAVYGAARLLGADKEETLRALSALRSVRGRFEPVRSASGITAIVDYAHTPDALENVIATVNDIRKPSQQLIAVCGCGGDRDRAKRPEMGAIASRDASIAIFTSDNPRTEDPEAILDEIMAGVREGARCLRIADRAQAIRTAVMLARPNDIILVAGKGHETYQIVGREKRHFDDREELAAAFREMKV